MPKNAIASISLPDALSKEIDKVAKKEHRTKSGVIQEAVRQYLELRKWREAQREVSMRARRLGLSTDDDVEKLIDEVCSV